MSQSSQLRRDKQQAFDTQQEHKDFMMKLKTKITATISSKDMQLKKAEELVAGLHDILFDMLDKGCLAQSAS